MKTITVVEEKNKNKKGALKAIALAFLILTPVSYFVASAITTNINTSTPEQVSK